jgi:hypothetical protein
MRALFVLLTLASPALADPMPGTDGDPVRELMLEPAFVAGELPAELAVRGASPEDTIVLLDGFEIPWALHGSGLRSIIAPGAADLELHAGTFGVEYGRGSNLVAIAPRNAEHAMFGELTIVDVSAYIGAQNVAASVRGGHDHVADEWRPSDGSTFVDALAYLDLRVTNAWTVATAALATVDPDRDAFRVVTGARYDTRTWLASIAVSPLVQSEGDADRLSLDTRAEVMRRASRAAGLTRLEWRLGQQTISSLYDLPLGRQWRHDLAGWSSIGANLSSRVRASFGLRVDSFDGDVATQPRGNITLGLTRHLELALSAGAYRRPPRRLAEVLDDSLGPERATHVVATTTFDENRGYRIAATAYYIDRRRLIAPDDAGVIGNSGFGTSLGGELAATAREGSWFARIATALSRSRRTDYLRGRERSAPFEQPFRLDLIGGWTTRRLTLSGRLRLASGLPYTPYDGAIYDSDTDTWTPRYVEPLSARTPFRHQIDLRVDYRFTLATTPVTAFVDLHNAYASETALLYRYSYDYAQRAAVSALPLFPFAGLRAYL